MINVSITPKIFKELYWGECLNFEYVKEDYQGYIKLFSENNTGLYYCLDLLWSHGIQTLACCGGNHKNASFFENGYLAISYNTIINNKGDNRGKELFDYIKENCHFHTIEISTIYGKDNSKIPVIVISLNTFMPVRSFLKIKRVLNRFIKDNQINKLQLNN